MAAVPYYQESVRVEMKPFESGGGRSAMAAIPTEDRKGNQAPKEEEKRGGDGNRGTPG